MSFFVLAGCGQSTKHYLPKTATSEKVYFSVDLNRAFVKSMSSLSGGQAAMLILVGPFTNNAILLEAKELIQDGERIAFRHRLSWGENKFTSFLEENKNYQLNVLVQGTRSGVKKIGEIGITNTRKQAFDLILHDDLVKFDKSILDKVNPDEWDDQDANDLTKVKADNETPG